jgi:cAMP-dependent protein kinase regulator
MSVTLQGMDEEDLNVIIDAMDEKKVKAGETVITEGEKGDVLFLVEDGVLECFKQMVH